MISLNLPSFDIKIRREGNRAVVLDPLRRRWVALTPEEWVRQHFVNLLVSEKHYPATLVANEVQLSVGEKVMRADTVVYDRTLRPRMIVEYKAPTVAITQKVFDQISVYNLLLRVDYLAQRTAALRMPHGLRQRKIFIFRRPPRLRSFLTKRIVIATL